MAKKRKLTPAATSSSSAVDGEEKPVIDLANLREVKTEPHDETLDQSHQQTQHNNEPKEEAKNEEEEEDEEEEEEEEEEEDEENEKDPASIQNLLDSFPKDQLVELLRDAAVSHSDVLSAIHRAADADPAQRKIFVHGLGWDATAETLAAIFGHYGEIEDLKVVSDRATGKCKGYGFILFRRRSGAREALLEPQKKIGNRTAACQLASIGPVPPGGQSSSGPAPQAHNIAQVTMPQYNAPAQSATEYTMRKIFVSNVGAEVDPQKLLQFFARFGEIEEGPLGLDKATGKPKGFALFVYKSVESAKKALEEPHKNFDGVVLHVQKAIDGPKAGKGGGAGGFFHGLGGSGAGRKVGGSGFGGGSHHLPGPGHLMAPPATGLGSQAAALTSSPALNPALGQALTALLASQGAGVGLNSLFGGIGMNSVGGPVGNPAATGAMGGSGGPGMQGGYGNAGMMGGYGVPGSMQGGGYGNLPQGGAGGRYMGH